MPAPSVPSADAKIGQKIEFFAKRLARVLKPQGFTRRSRVLYRERGEGTSRCIQLIDFQGDKWNEGKRGRFTINLGVSFPALLEMQHGLPGLEWLAHHANPYELAFGPGGFQGRLPDALPEQRDPRWPSELTRGDDSWAAIDPSTDLARLAEGLEVAIVGHALVWLDQRSQLSAFESVGEAALGAPGAREQVLAAILDRKPELAARRLRSTPAHRLASDQAQFDGLLRLVGQCNVVVEGVAWTEPATDPMRQRRTATVKAAATRHVTQVDAFLDRHSTIAGNEDAFLDAWVHEDAANQLADSVAGYRLWQLAAVAGVAERRALLLRLFERLPEPGPTVESTVANVWATYRNYHVSAWRKLAVAIFDADNEGCDREHAVALMQGLALTTSQLIEGLVSDEFAAPFVPAIKWFEAQCDSTVRFETRPALAGLLAAIRDSTIARSRARLSQMPPANLLGEDLAEQVAAMYTPEARAAWDRLYAECPERSFAAADRDAILKIKRWLRAEPDGRVALEIESDDWGRQLSAAVVALPGEEGKDFVSLLEWLDASANSKPTKRWWAELETRRRAIPEAAMVDWLRKTLPLFANTELRHFLGAPGYLGFPGETSGRVLLGLVQLAGALKTPVLLPALETVAEAAFKVIPDQRMRAYTIGAACLEPLADHAAGREALARLRASHRQKTVRAAIDKALERTASGRTASEQVSRGRSCDG